MLPLVCTFAEQGFRFESGRKCLPCGTWYHPECLEVGPPFESRHPSGKGLCFPRTAEASMFPNYTCEACQVRAILGRELRHTSSDGVLLMLERMRMLDSMHRLAEGSQETYKYRLRRVRRFEGMYGVEILTPTKLSKPPVTKAIPLMWTQLEYTLQPGKKPETRIKFSSARGLRSACSSYYQWDAFMCEHTSENQEGILLDQRVIPTEELRYTFMSKGMQRRMGTNSKQAQAMQYQHVKFLDEQYERSFAGTTDPAQQQEIAAAATANLLFWLGWLRGGERFGLLRQDVEVIRPEEGPQHGLYFGNGYIRVLLLPETKSSPGVQADVVISYHCWSGLCLGVWLETLLSFPGEPDSPLFSTPAKTKWDSRYFRSRHVWPYLEVMRAMGEPSLQNCSDEEGQRIADRFYSIHSYRRGTDSFVQKFRSGIHLRKATTDEMYEHARWRKRAKGSTEDMHIHYREWPLHERLHITQQCY